MIIEIAFKFDIDQFFACLFLFHFQRVYILGANFTSNHMVKQLNTYHMNMSRQIHDHSYPKRYVLHDKSDKVFPHLNNNLTRVSSV